MRILQGKILEKKTTWFENMYIRIVLFQIQGKIKNKTLVAF